MSKIWFTSDNHFGHKNVMKFCPATRPWSSVEEMDNAMIEQWNIQVSPEDTVYILGDFSFHKLQKTLEILYRLNGKKTLIIGNHDEHLLKHPEFRNVFYGVYPYACIELPNPVDGTPQLVVMLHYPIYEWNRMHRGAFHLHGHVHGKEIPVDGRIMDVGFDPHGRLLSWEEVYNTLIDKPIRTH